jgi:non-canonical (house-cleaning) NTP pyrophosphatase
MYPKVMKISICGSMHHIDAMLEAKQTLERQGYEIETPSLSETTDYGSLSSEERVKRKDFLIREHLNKISTSDAVLIFNEEKKGIKGYIGGNTLMEMAFAYAQSLEIFLYQPAPDLSYKDEVQGMKPIVLNGNIQAIDAYFSALPKTFVSSKSPVKLAAISRGMRRSGIYTQVIARPTQSNVAEQPQSIEETYEGAENRHASLKQETAVEKPAYYATVESGNHVAHPKHNTFSVTVAILEKGGDAAKTGIALELELPKEMTDKVPSQYPDLGVLVQQEYGSTLKDPFPYFTGGKVNRLQLVENAVFNVAVQLPDNK